LHNKSMTGCLLRVDLAVKFAKRQLHFGMMI